MNILRNVARAALALVLAASAVVAGAQNVKYFELAAPGSIPVTTTAIDVTFTNRETSNSTFNAVSVAWTTSPNVTLAVTNARSYPANGGNYVDVPGDKIAVTDLPPTKKGQSITIRLTVQITATSCAGGSITWIGGAWTGSVSSPSTPFVQFNADPTTNVQGPACTVEFERAPASALLVSGSAAISSVANTAPTVGNYVKAVVKNGGVVDATYTGPINIERVAYPTGSTISGNTVAIASAGTAEFPLLSVNSVGVYSLRATAGTHTPSPAVSILVSNALLDCAYYDNSTNPPTLVTTGAKVVVGDNWEFLRFLDTSKNQPCTKANYIHTVGSASGTADPNGFILGTDFFSLVYNNTPDGMLLRHTYISSPYAVNGDGTVTEKKVKYCVSNTAVDGAYPCSLLSNQVASPACLTDKVEAATVPGTAPGCTQGKGWFLVPVSECTAAGVSAPNGCVRFQIDLVESKDPPWGLTDE